jgi:predicted nucleic acid-binding protein
LIYFDSAYIVKCYLHEPGSKEVRGLAEAGEAVASCELARVEFSAAVHRHAREKDITEKQAGAIFQRFRRDIREGYWTFYPMTSQLLEECGKAFETLPRHLFLRTADALHILCARNQGFKVLYTNDVHLRAAAPTFGLKAIDVILH